MRVERHVTTTILARGASRTTRRGVRGQAGRWQVVAGSGHVSIVGDLLYVRDDYCELDSQ
jgi:hypothetical protein